MHQSVIVIRATGSRSKMTVYGPPNNKKLLNQISHCIIIISFYYELDTVQMIQLLVRVKFDQKLICGHKYIVIIFK